MIQLINSRHVLAVRDLTASTSFFLDDLGFQRDFGDGSDGWSFLSRDGFKVMLGECPDAPAARDIVGHSYVAYVIVEGVDEFFDELSNRGVHTFSPPVTEPWGLREFTVRTPDGHRIKFGEPVLAAS